MEEASSTSDWLTTTLIIVGTSVAVLVPMLYFLRPKARLLTFVQFFVPDGSGRFLHVFGSERRMPDDGESFDVWYHRVLDVEKLVFYQGESKRGDDLELDSPFVKRSMAQLSGELGVELSLGSEAQDVDDQEDPDENDQYALRSPHPPMVYREGTESDTVKPKHIPKSCILVNQISSEPERFRISLRRDGAEVASHLVSGDADYFGKVIWLHDRPWVAMTYRRMVSVRSGMAMLILDYKTGQMVFDQFITGSAKARKSAAAQQ